MSRKHPVALPSDTHKGGSSKNEASANLRNEGSFKPTQGISLSSITGSSLKEKELALERLIQEMKLKNQSLKQEAERVENDPQLDLHPVGEDKVIATLENLGEDKKRLEKELIAMENRIKHIIAENDEIETEMVGYDQKTRKVLEARQKKLQWEKQMLEEQKVVEEEKLRKKIELEIMAKKRDREIEERKEGYYQKIEQSMQKVTEEKKIQEQLKSKLEEFEHIMMENRKLQIQIDSKTNRNDHLYNEHLKKLEKKEKLLVKVKEENLKVDGLSDKIDKLKKIEAKMLEDRKASMCQKGVLKSQFQDILYKKLEEKEISELLAKEKFNPKTGLPRNSSLNAMIQELEDKKKPVTPGASTKFVGGNIGSHTQRRREARTGERGAMTDRSFNGSRRDENFAKDLSASKQGTGLQSSGVKTSQQRAAPQTEPSKKQGASGTQTSTAMPLKSRTDAKPKLQAEIDTTKRRASASGNISPFQPPKSARLGAGKKTDEAPSPLTPSRTTPGRTSAAGTSNRLAAKNPDKKETSGQGLGDSGLKPQRTGNVSSKGSNLDSKAKAVLDSNVESIIKGTKAHIAQKREGVEVQNPEESTHTFHDEQDQPIVEQKVILREEIPVQTPQFRPAPGVVRKKSSDEIPEAPHRTAAVMQKKKSIIVPDDGEYVFDENDDPAMDPNMSPDIAPDRRGFPGDSPFPHPSERRRNSFKTQGATDSNIEFDRELKIRQVDALPPLPPQAHTANPAHEQSSDLHFDDEDNPDAKLKTPNDRSRNAIPESERRDNSSILKKKPSMNEHDRSHAKSHKTTGSKRKVSRQGSKLDGTNEDMMFDEDDDDINKVKSKHDSLTQ